MFTRVDHSASAPLRMFKNDLFEEFPTQGDVLGRATSNVVDATTGDEKPANNPTPMSPLQARLESQRLKQQMARKQRIQVNTLDLSHTRSKDGTL